MNNVILMGRLTADPELRQTQSGSTTCSFTVACDRRSKGEKTADFIRCVAFHETAKAIADYFSKGNKILIQGNIKTGSYEKDGRTVYTTDIWVDRFEFVESRQNEQTAQPAPKAKAAEPIPDGFEEIISDNELPF